jgi:3-deoxy-manno-octulosonate cytidylyltransferase (CMP-KDO synthetase)
MTHKVLGVVPARMGARRFPGKPLHPIKGRTMLDHCYRRATLYPGWDDLVVATCDAEISDYCDQEGIPCVMTSGTHTRALDRVAEAMAVVFPDFTPEDIVVCVQGDEPLLGPDVLAQVIEPLQTEAELDATLLACPIVEEEVFLNPDTVKIIHDLKGNALYSSRSPIPFTHEFSPETGALRIGGIFGFRRAALEQFTDLPESPLEIKESCDSNRLYDNGLTQRVCVMSTRPYFSVDSEADVARVEAALETDSLWGSY